MEFEIFPGEIFTFEQIKAATKNFHPDCKICEGRFGAVYKGVLLNGMEVAVKKLPAKSNQGALEFMTEFVTTYAVKHANLVRLLGGCAKKNDLLLVYEYMQNNSLEHVLFGKAEVKARLNWLTRVKICHDVAKGLAYLHEESKYKIIHRDIKPTNILLDKDFVAKISDFGYAQLNEEENTPLIKGIAGTKGYMAPEYMQGKLTAKADVYSFGIVILVIVSGKNISSLGPKQQTVYLWEQAYDYQKQGNLIALLDPSLRSKYTNDQVTKLLDLAMGCINPSLNLRPSMSQVAKVLQEIVEVEAAKWETKVISTPSPSAVHDPIMEEPPVAYSQSTKLAGGTSTEGVELYPGSVFNFHKIKAATNNFDTKNKIGEGGGTVYKGVLPDGVEIAVKQLSVQSKQRARTIINEIGTIYALQDPNITRPMGFCAEKNQVLLVYKYMENISLRHALFGSEVHKSRLNWPTRVKICLGMAKGLAFLHEGSRLDIIHSNIKPSSILLDKDFNVKISDFGYAQLHDAQLHYQDTTSGNMPKAERKAHMAPEYMQGLPLTPKADVYSFGIVTLEIVSGQNIITYGPKNQNIYLLNLAYQYQLQQNLIALVDSNLGSNYKHNEALNILDLAMRCVSPSFDLRPKMSDAVKVLEGKIKLKTSSTNVPHA